LTINLFLAIVGTLGFLAQLVFNGLVLWFEWQDRKRLAVDERRLTADEKRLTKDEKRLTVDEQRLSAIRAGRRER